ncbi:hypothetical protein MAPG_09024 [Magnaporthiopsis poae ATCC 64411]|uniref:Uncharacterized protein n=1 Tax=Magnaporthiopsis poae (strain ATCC 64411 / 73-15) TaxID=644358 RepID=A0A0C4E8V4_MAGP6|nr:hypothetical protein MAPG_09024 [Magnaporthiopsis poae ATCC 64411]
MREVAFPINFFFFPSSPFFHPRPLHQHIFELQTLPSTTSAFPLTSPYPHFWVPSSSLFPCPATKTATSLATQGAISKGCCFACSSPAARTWHVHVHTHHSDALFLPPARMGLGIPWRLTVHAARPSLLPKISPALCFFFFFGDDRVRPHLPHVQGSCRFHNETIPRLGAPPPAQPMQAACGSSPVRESACGSPIRTRLGPIPFAPLGSPRSTGCSLPPSLPFCASVNTRNCLGKKQKKKKGLSFGTAAVQGNIPKGNHVSWVGGCCHNSNPCSQRTNHTWGFWSSKTLESHVSPAESHLEKPA